VLILMVVIVLSVCLRRWYIRPKYLETDKLSLERDGVVMLPGVLSPHQVVRFRHLAKRAQYKKIKEEILGDANISQRLGEATGPGYVFQDYIWMIMKSNVHTCHRDNNGDFFNTGQSHPSYTLLFYLEEMDSCLDVIPRSHTSLWRHSVQWTDTTQHIPCRPGSVVLFNANLVHTGSFNPRPDNMRIQMKWTHQDDLSIIDYYNDFNKYVDKPNKVPLSIRRLQKHLTCQFPILSDITQSTNIQTARGSSSQGVHIPWTQKWFSYLAYGNPNYYDLPDAEHFTCHT